ncbi:MAG: hypothetical protein R3248_01650 [Candidatus Promineifilaceae bacterium]|nr:hypothetical protein [Candidatus Promineifilaceae bacterium]
MNTQSLYRWGGMVAILTAAFFVLGGVLAAVVSDGGLSTPVVPALYYFGTTAAVLAFLALYAAQCQQTGILGLVGFLLATMGAVLYSGPQFALVAGTSGAAGWHDVWGFGMGNILLVGPPAFFIGMSLIGAATRRAAVLPRHAGLVLAVGAFVWLVAYFLSIVPGLLTVASVLTGVGMAWMGWALWSGRSGTVTVQPQVV